MIVREATRADLGPIQAIDSEGFAQPGRRQLLLRRLADARVLSASDHGALVGYALQDRFFGYDFLELLFVVADRRRQGLGRALVQAWEARRSTARLFVSTNQSNTPMRALLSASGFAISGRIVNLDPGDPELVFVKRFDGQPVEY